MVGPGGLDQKERESQNSNVCCDRKALPMSRGGSDSPSVINRKTGAVGGKAIPCVAELSDEQEARCRANPDGTPGVARYVDPRASCFGGKVGICPRQMRECFSSLRQSTPMENSLLQVNLVNSPVAKFRTSNWRDRKN